MEPPLLEAGLTKLVRLQKNPLAHGVGVEFVC